MCELDRNSDYSREGGEQLFPRLSSWSEVLSPRAGVCLLAIAWSRDGPARLGAPSDPLQHRFPSACWEDRFSQAQSCAVWSWHLPYGNSKPLSTALSFSLQPRTGRQPVGWFSHWETGWGLGNPSAVVWHPDLGPSMGIPYNAEMARERELCGDSPRPSGHGWVGHWHGCGLRNVTGCLSGLALG